VAKSPVTRISADLDDGATGPGPDHTQRLVQIGDLNLGVPAHHLLALDERPVGDDRLTTVEPHGRRRLRGLQFVPAPDLAGIGGHPLHDPLIRTFAFGRAHGLQVALELLRFDE
jgi:hypothetical protein